jgi:hypothetical protein
MARLVVTNANLIDAVTPGVRAGCSVTVEDERIVDGEFGRKISVPSELAAWRWVLDRAPVWTAEMHAFMGRCLTSYRSYAIEPEAHAMDVLCSRLSFLQTRLRISTAPR